MSEQPRKKLIEVALPLEAINRESAREKSIRHGHPSTLHLWWARRPLAACRAVLFASLVDDPSAHPDRFPTEEDQERERQHLFRIIEELVKWENSTNETVLEAARAEIRRSTNGNPPPVLDPFCGGGSIPLEAQRLGLEAHASDLNPVAVLITKALIEIPPKFAGRPPVNPADRAKLGGTGTWRGAAGLAADVRHYGRWMRDEVERRIGHLYPKVRLPKEHGGSDATVIAWLWARTVQCPNPACGACMPLVRSFWLSTKPNRKAWVEPVVDRAAKSVRFEVKTGQGVPPDGTVNRRGAACIVCGAAVPFDHVRAEGRARRMNAQLMAIVAEGQRGRVYLPPSEEHERVAEQAQPNRVPDTELPEQALGFRVQGYGMIKHRDLFTPRQLVALTAFTDLVSEARERVRCDGAAASLPDDGMPLTEGGTGTLAYADAVATYLGLAASKAADGNSTICTWMPGVKYEVVRTTFSRQAVPMTWDYAESNPFAGSSGDYDEQVGRTSKVLQLGVVNQALNPAQTGQSDVTSLALVAKPVVSTDPPYYDNVPYADLSDFFYVWLRRSLGEVHSDLFATLLTPKARELVADAYRFGGNRDRAKQFFEEGLGKAFVRIREIAHPDYPLTVYYAFKQAESGEEDVPGSGVNSVSMVASTGWETMLEGLLGAGLSITGTWPVRTERLSRLRDTDSNALASSIVLICRLRPENARAATLAEFQRALKRELPGALRKLQHGNIAPVDLAQAAIGPGMAIFSRYSKVLETDGSPMRIRRALQLINQALDEVLAEQEAEYDTDTRWAVAWFEQFGMNEGQYGVAETLSKAKNSSVEGMKQAGIVAAGAGKVRLLRRDELPAGWDPSTDSRVPVWELTQQLIRALDERGEQGAAELLARAPAQGEVARDLAYRLFTTCERKGWAQEALAYNALVVAWPEIVRLAVDLSTAPQQVRLV